jgi:hypothetical protein
MRGRQAPGAVSLSYRYDSVYAILTHVKIILRSFRRLCDVLGSPLEHMKIAKSGGFIDLLQLMINSVNCPTEPVATRYGSALGTADAASYRQESAEETSVTSFPCCCG